MSKGILWHYPGRRRVPDQSMRKRTRTAASSPLHELTGFYLAVDCLASRCNGELTVYARPLGCGPYFRPWQGAGQPRTRKHFPQCCPVGLQYVSHDWVVPKSLQSPRQTCPGQWPGAC